MRAAIGAVAPQRRALDHHVSILTMNGDSYRLKESAGRKPRAARAEQNQATAAVDPDTGEVSEP